MTDEMNLHARDILNLADVKAQIRCLFGMRKAVGWQVKDMQQEKGRAHGYIARMLSENRFPWDWKWSTMSNLGEALMFRPAAHVSGFEMPSTPMLEIGLKNPVFLGVGILESFQSLREGQNLTAVEVGLRIGVSDSGIWKIENSDNPKLSTLMRYTRALGGELRFAVEELS